MTGKMSPLLTEALEYLRELEDRQWQEVYRDDRSSDDRYVYRERALVIRAACDELVRRYAPR